MERHKTIYFFGAGASAAESPVAPTTSKLLRGGLETRPRCYQTLRQFLADWGFAGGTLLPTIEELLSILDNCLSKGEPIGQQWSISDLTKCREELVTCIYDVIGDTVDANQNGHGDNGLYLQLLKRLPPESTSLISPNYDLLIDHALEKLGLDPDYGLDFMSAGAPDGPPPLRPPTGHRGSFRFFKLHGSLNWGYCPSCFTTVHARGQRLDAEGSCPTCGGLLNALIVPPTPLKVPPSPFLSALWKKAEWELRQACEIVFIGYSLSDADANIRYLLFRGFFGYTPKVTVVVKQQGPHEDQPVLGRYRRLFPGGVEVFRGGFEEFAGRRATR